MRSLYEIEDEDAALRLQGSERANAVLWFLSWLVVSAGIVGAAFLLLT